MAIFHSEMILVKCLHTNPAVRSGPRTHFCVIFVFTPSLFKLKLEHNTSVASRGRFAAPMDMVWQLAVNQKLAPPTVTLTQPVNNILLKKQLKSQNIFEKRPYQRIKSTNLYGI